MPLEPDAVEIRVVGCLIEKQRTTPDAYPLSLNSLRLACSQSTNRDPVVDYDEATVSEALRRLALRGWTRLACGAGSRARKYRHLLPEALDVDEEEISLLAVLMLRGAADPGRAEAAQRAAAPLRRPRRGRGDARAAGRPRHRRPPRAAAGPEGGALRAAARRRGGEGAEPAPAVPSPTSAADQADAGAAPCRRPPPHPPPARTGSSGSNASCRSCAPSSPACARRSARAPARPRRVRRRVR